MNAVAHIFQNSLVLTIDERVAAECRARGVRNVREASRPSHILDSQGRVLPEVAEFENFVILIPEGGEDIRDTIAVSLGDERCRWAYIPEQPENLPTVIAGAKHMWLDEVCRLSDVPHPGKLKLYATGFEGLDVRLVTPAFMPIIGPYGSGKSVFLRQLLINLWKLHGWKFLLTSFEEKIRPRFERDLIRHCLGTVESSWTQDDYDRGFAEVNRACVFMARKRNTVLDMDRMIDRIRYAVRVYGLRVVAIDPFNEIDHQVPYGMSKTDYIGQTIIKLKQLADDHNLLMIVALHPPKDGVEKRLQKNGLITLNDGADSAHWGNKADIGFCMWRPADGPTLLHVDKVKDHETMGKPTLCEMIHVAALNKFEVGRTGYDVLMGDGL